MVTRTVRRLLPVLLPLLALAACAPGNRLYVPGDLTRPPGAAKRGEGIPQVAVADFAYTAPSQTPEVIGRDYDQVRQILWKGNPGTAMADLVADVLAERGIPAVRVRTVAEAAGRLPFVVGGSVRRFEVNARRGGTFSVLTEATVTVALSVSGSSVSRPWETTVTSGTTLQDLFAVPDDLRRALQSAANSAAEEAVRRLQEGGVTASPEPTEKGADATTR
jgi:hypothetical protein